VHLFAQKTPVLKDMFAPIHRRGFEYEGIIIPPNDRTNWITCFSREKIKQADLDAMNTYDGGLKLMIFFEYSNTSRRPGANTPAKYVLLPEDQEPDRSRLRAPLKTRLTKALLRKLQTETKLPVCV
jgi:hypothetical protein